MCRIVNIPCQEPKFMEQYRCETFRVAHFKDLQIEINRWLIQNPSAIPINISNSYMGTMNNGCYLAALLYKK